MSPKRKTSNLVGRSPVSNKVRHDVRRQVKSKVTIQKVPYQSISQTHEASIPIKVPLQQRIKGTVNIMEVANHNRLHQSNESEEKVNQSEKSEEKVSQSEQIIDEDGVARKDPEYWKQLRAKLRLCKPAPIVTSSDTSKIPCLNRALIRAGIPRNITSPGSCGLEPVKSNISDGKSLQHSESKKTLSAIKDLYITKNKVNYSPHFEKTFVEVVSTEEVP